MVINKKQIQIREMKALIDLGQNKIENLIKLASKKIEVTTNE